MSVPDPAIERIVQIIAPGSRLVRRSPLEGGISNRMAVLSYARPGAQVETMILRTPGGGDPMLRAQAVEKEYRLLRLAQTAGLPVPAPVYLDLSGEILPAPYLIEGCIEGKPDYAPPDLDDFIFQAAVQLAGIHRAGAGQDLGFLAGPGGEPGRDANRTPSSLEHAMEEGRIRAALAAVRPAQNAPALLHGDYWPGNLLWREGSLVGVVDWEDACLGDPLIDLAISRLDICWIFGADAMRAFTRHYLARTAIDSAYLPYWDLAAALRLIRLAAPDLAGWAAFFHPYGRRDITVESILAAYRDFIEQAFAGLKAFGNGAA